MTTAPDSFEIGYTPFNLSGELDNGTFVAQVRGGFNRVAEKLLYIASADPPPTDRNSWYQLSVGQTLRFSVDPVALPVWFVQPAGGLANAVTTLAVGPSISTLSTDAPLPSPVVVSGITVTAADLAAFLKIDEERAGQLLEVAACIIGEYAPRAPTAVANEACRRFAGYLREAPGGAIRSENVVPLSVDYQSTHSAMFRLCGAAGMLSRWKIRRAGAIA